MLFDQPSIERRRPVFLPRKKSFQLRKSPSAFGKLSFQSRHPFPVRGGIAPQRTGLVREKGDDGISEIFLQLLIIAVVGQRIKASTASGFRISADFGAPTSPSSSPK